MRQRLVHTVWCARPALRALRPYSSAPKPPQDLPKPDEWTNVPDAILGLVGRNLHHNPAHPIGIIREMVEARLQPMGFTHFNEFSPVVSKYLNFDSLGFAEDHPGRAKSDTYYFNKDTLLRTHTSGHEIECLQLSPTPGYTITADVYRRDTIDRTHYPAFHQMEGARSWSLAEFGGDQAKLAAHIRADLATLPVPDLKVEDTRAAFHEENPKQVEHSDELSQVLSQHLKRTIELIMVDLFQQAKQAAKAAGSRDPDLEQPLKARWIDAFFPWTAPSYEIEIWWKGEWLEMCGCGVVRQDLYNRADLPQQLGWAFGLGLERMAMILFGIPDIRLFWSQDPRFLNQFQRKTVSVFQPWSKFPGSSRDVAFWRPAETEVHENDVMEIVRAHGSDLVESVALVDEFVHPSDGRQSQCYRINFQSMERSLTNDEINKIHAGVVHDLESQFGVEVR